MGSITYARLSACLMNVSAPWPAARMRAALVPAKGPQNFHHAVLFFIFKCIFVELWAAYILTLSFAAALSYDSVPGVKTWKHVALFLVGKKFVENQRP